jgi:predicted short-subunit dehydrogenase-like oxidoreductase (DUF2520 family)
VSRGDTATVATHLATLRTAAPESVDAYLSLARRTAERAHASGRLSDASYEAILATLRSG